ncbi:MAG: hypothetical protein JWL81_3427 [Verrucomicrobiales bacterium]|nr:hypothetical protein [Verrucomicrobiales bacterium]
MKTAKELVRQYFEAYDSGDRRKVEPLLCEDFIFTGPEDDYLGKQEFFDRCWPEPGSRYVHHLGNIFQIGNEYCVTYQCQPPVGDSFHNTEFFLIQGNRIRQIEVPFDPGSPDLTDAVADASEDPGMDPGEAGIRQLLEEMAKAWRDKNAGALAALYLPGARIFDPGETWPGEAADQGRRGAADWFRSFKGRPDYQISALEMTSGEESGFCHYHVRLRGQSTESGPLEFRWRVTLGCVKTPDGWRVAHSHTSIPAVLPDDPLKFRQGHQ